MENITETRRKINEFCNRTGKYAPDAYEFVTSCVVEQSGRMNPPRHLSALEVVQGIQKKLSAEFGCLAGEVTEYWQMQTSNDVGEIVFDLIDLQILNASEDDKRSDFDLDMPLVETPQKNFRYKTKSDMEIPKIV